MKTISRHFTNIGTQPRPDLYCAVQVIELCVMRITGERTGEESW